MELKEDWAMKKRNGQTDRRTDGQTDGRTVQSLYALFSSKGGIKIKFPTYLPTYPTLKLKWGKGNNVCGGNVVGDVGGGNILGGGGWGECLEFLLRAKRF
ncbi:hypothetical protein DPMN_023963 [Dreissena polymorpha]|uniref:Uncharacterized protein n=1 Tax=Dreissena polymorpha TaxID=45954 RepID=A0A9D4LLT1_DREPO|nr:hypothetical protein DPMN_023963 [Dreissena polymorpha]